jgi:hypothetical protein
MTVYVWTDRRNPAVPRALIQRGDCTRDHCGQFSISISDGQVGLTVRFESEEEFRRFLQGEAAAPQVSCVSESSPTSSAPT